MLMFLFNVKKRIGVPDTNEIFKITIERNLATQKCSRYSQS